MQPQNHAVPFWRYSQGNWETLITPVVAEAPVSLTINGDIWLTFQCTPTGLESLAIGFLYNEGFIHSLDEIASVRLCENGENIDVWLHHKLQKPPYWKRTSGCTGGVSSPEHVVHPLDLSPDQLIQPEKIIHCMRQLFLAQELYRESRGVHCSMLTDGEGTNLLAEDIGRHNTLDKLAGQMLLKKPVLTRRLILTTGRISLEMLHKSATLQAALVVSRTSPTTLSIQEAETLGITLVGYARSAQFNVYTHPERFLSPLPLPTFNFADAG